ITEDEYMSTQHEPDGEIMERLSQPAPRRDFLKWSGAGALGLLGLAACSDDTDIRSITEVVTKTDTLRIQPPPPPPPVTFPSVTLNFASDTGVLNYAYALEQLEAAFYTAVVGSSTFAATFSAQEQRVLTDLRDHEVIHREFFRVALGNNAIPMLTFNLSAVNLQSRLSVLNAARDFEDLGVAAYNGAGRFLQSADLLTVAGKIVSVEARHASAIRDLLQPRSGNFAPQAFDPALTPGQVLGVAAPFVRNQIVLANMPA
ncbi:MAG TPA: ferritin-like domain-containing protein, partial [Longimicrobium sp.]|nr:ferritin-like domain-containing protein [Longimicrobium sp.]